METLNSQDALSDCSGGFEKGEVARPSWRKQTLPGCSRGRRIGQKSRTRKENRHSLPDPLQEEGWKEDDMQSGQRPALSERGRGGRPS